MDGFLRKRTRKGRACPTEKWPPINHLRKRAVCPNIKGFPCKGSRKVKGRNVSLQSLSYFIDKRLVHVVLYIILGHYFGMKSRNFGMKTYYYLLFRLTNWEKTCFGPISSLFRFRPKITSQNIIPRTWNRFKQELLLFFPVKIKLKREPKLDTNSNQSTFFHSI